MKRYKALILFVLLLGSCRERSDATSDDQQATIDYIPVRVESVNVEEDAFPIYAMGRLAASSQTKLSYKTGGYIAQLMAEDGDYVRKGTLIGTMRMEEINAQVLKAQRALEKAERDLTRVTAMYKDSVATLENVEDLNTLVEVRKADLEIATYNQTHSNIVAPHSGRILNRLAEENELIAAGQPIFVLSAGGNQSYVMNAKVSDKDVGLVAKGSNAKIYFDAFPDHTFEAVLTNIAESADPMLGTFTIEFSLAPTKYRLRNGMIGRVEFEAEGTREYLKVPMLSVAEGDADRIIVYTAEGDKAKRHELRVVRIMDHSVWVYRDETPINSIITDGSAYLKDGQKIKITQ